jgi:excisionase family DNA binding protein
MSLYAAGVEGRSFTSALYFGTLIKFALSCDGCYNFACKAKCIVCCGIERSIKMSSREIRKDAVSAKRVYEVGEIAEILGISLTSAYELIKREHFKTVRIGRAIRISKKSFDEWLDTLDLQPIFK